MSARTSRELDGDTSAHASPDNPQRPISRQFELEVCKRYLPLDHQFPLLGSTKEKDHKYAFLGLAEDARLRLKLMMIWNPALLPMITWRAYDASSGSDFEGDISGRILTAKRARVGQCRVRTTRKQ